jgi:hypothetical protein
MQKYHEYMKCYTPISELEILTTASGYEQVITPTTELVDCY